MTNLDEVRAYCNAATEGPWEAKQNDAQMSGRGWFRFGPANAPKVFDVPSMLGQDATFIAQARTDLPRLAAFARDVLELHRPLREFEDYDRCGHTDDEHTIVNGPDGDPLCEQTYIVRKPKVCEECRDEYGDPVAHPCPTVELAREHGIGDAE